MKDSNNDFCGDAESFKRIEGLSESQCIEGILKYKKKILTIKKQNNKT